MTTSIASVLGIGSGIDTRALIESLAAATRAPKEALIEQREALNSARISTLAEVSNAIDSFASALKTLISGGTLFTQPSVSDTSILGATAIPGSNLSNLSTEVEVVQLAKAQSLVSVNLASASDPVGQGDLTLTTASGTHVITIDASNDSLTGLAQAINAKNAGVTATVVTDTAGSRLMIKGGTGAANAFTLTVPGGTTSGLERFTYDPGGTSNMTAAQIAQDAIVRVDGVEVSRAKNSISDLIEGVQLDLKKAAPGSTVSLGITRPTTAIGQAVNDFVAAYNELHAMLAEATAPAVDGAGTGGPLRGDLGIRTMQRELAELTSTVLNTSGGPSTLAEIGVATNRDGTLRVDAARLTAMLESDPAGVEALFNPRQYSDNPLVTIFSKPGAAKPGTYVLTDLVPESGGTPATGKVDGVAMISSGPHLIAPASSPAVGLVVEVLGATASATITVDAGLGGALQAIRDSLRAKTGPLAVAQQRLQAEAKDIARDRESLEARMGAYYEQLEKNFTAMDRQLLVFKATQSYLEQQIKMWSNGQE